MYGEKVYVSDVFRKWNCWEGNPLIEENGYMLSEERIKSMSKDEIDDVASNMVDYSASGWYYGRPMTKKEAHDVVEKLIDCANNHDDEYTAEDELEYMFNSSKIQDSELGREKCFDEERKLLNHIRFLHQHEVIDRGLSVKKENGKLVAKDKNGKTESCAINEKTEEHIKAIDKYIDLRIPEAMSLLDKMYDVIPKEYTHICCEASVRYRLRVHYLLRLIWIENGADKKFKYSWNGCDDEYDEKRDFESILEAYK